MFTVGLMHGIGQLQLHVAAPEAVQPLDKALHPLDAGRAALEKKTLGFHNGDVAANVHEPAQNVLLDAIVISHHVEAGLGGRVVFSCRNVA